MSAATLIPRHQATNPVTLPWICAPALFNHYAKALNWIMANNYGVQLLHYLDDFLLVGPPGKDTCHEAMSRVLLVCVLLGIPVASEKLEGPTTTLTFLGIVLDTLEQQLRLPRDKLQQRPEPLSPVATDQSLGPIYHNYLSHWCQMLPGFLPRLQADPSPWHERNYYTVKVHLSQSMNPRTIQVYVAAVSFLHHSLVYKSPASRNPMLRLAIQGLQRLQGAHSPQAYMTATDSGNAESHEAEDRPYQSRHQLVRKGHPLLHQAVEDQPDGQGYHYLHWVYQGQGHVSSGSNGGLQKMLSLFHSLNTPLPLQRWEINVAMIQPITTPTVYILVQPQQLPEWAFPLTPFKSLEDDKAQPTRHIPIIP
eukprot:Em0001g1882a